MVSTSGSNPLGLGSNPSGGTKLNNMNEKQLMQMCEMLALKCKQTFELAKEMKMLDEQWFLDWQDVLNEISHAYYGREVN